MQVRDVMTRGVVTVGSDTSAKYAAEVMAGQGFAALPVVDDAERLVGLVTEGAATIGRARGMAEVSGQVEERALRALAHTVAGVVSVRILPGRPAERLADRSEGRT
jgi:CBS-domain-containing membrane protein